MTRPRKQTVDYFPHYVKYGITIETLEQRYGLAGYAFWFKLLERLGDSIGHYLDCKNSITWAYLQTKTHQTPETCEEILNLLADLEAIDPELWKLDKVIWSQNFVDGISDAYRNRMVDAPTKPVIEHKKSVSNGVSDVRNPHRRVEESRGEENKIKKIKERATPLVFSSKHFEVDQEYFDELLARYPGIDSTNLSKELTKMKDWLDDHPKKHSRKSNGRMSSPKAFITRWLDKVELRPEAPTLCSHGINPKECKICRDHLFPQAKKPLPQAS